MVDDLVALSVPLARRIAPGSCRRDPVSGGDCAWYHGLWPYLRALGAVSSPSRHAEFLGETLRSLARDRTYRRVLICGAADHAMLAHVLWAYRQEANAPVDVTVVDVCETPLVLNRWYARQLGASVETRATDVLEYDATRPFDVVCTHSFLGRFGSAGRQRLIAKWRQLLRRDGKVLTVNRIRPSTTEDEVPFTPDEARAFQEAVLRRAAERPDLGVTPEQLTEALTAYVARYRTHPVRSRQEVSDLFSTGGFTIDRLDPRDAGGRSGDAPSGPSAAGNAEYAHIVASRR
jgi:hypothetical protein